MIDFTEEMRPLANATRFITDSKLANGKPAFEFRMVVGEYSEPEKMNYTWSIVEYNSKSLEIQVVFENPAYISM